MSWVNVPRTRPSPLKAPPAVVLSVSKSGKNVQRVFLTVRPDLLPELGWWRHHQQVGVQLGEGEHAGRLRITEGGVHRIAGPMGPQVKQGKPNAPTLQVKLDGLPEAGVLRRVVAWELLGGSLIVTLPWAGVTGCAKPAKTAPPAAKPPPPPRLDNGYPPAAGQPKPAVRTDAMAGITRQQVDVLTKLHRAGGVIPRGDINSLTHAEIATLRTCEDRRLAEWDAGRARWSLTPAGQQAAAALLDRAAQAAPA